MADVKITKAEKLEMIKEIVAASGNENTEILVEAIDTIITQDANKAAKAKERAAAKRAEGDELSHAIFGVLTSEFQTPQAIADTLGGEVTKGKVSARMKKFIDEGTVVKEVQKVDGKQVTVYKLA